VIPVSFDPSYVAIFVGEVADAAMTVISLFASSSFLHSTIGLLGNKTAPTPE
jgi:hypothetical protein